MANSMRRSGGGFRNPLITSADLPDGGVTTTKLADLAVTSAKIADLAVTSAKIGTAAITTAKIGDAQITSAKIASLSASKITSGTISAQTITIGSAGTIAGTNWEIAEDQWTIGGSTDFLRLDPSDNTVWGGSVTLESNLDGGKGSSGGSTFELTFGPGSTRPVTLISRYNNAGVVTAFTLLSYASAQWTMFGFLNVDEVHGGDGGTTDPSFTFANESGLGIYRHSTNQLAIAAAGAQTYLFDPLALNPGSDNATRLGSSSRRWTEVWAVDGSINTSDRREKKRIGSLAFDPGELIDLIPARRFQRRRRRRWHFGFIADEVRDGLVTLGMDPSRYGVYIEPEAVGEEGVAGLRIHELVPVLWDEVRRLRSRVRELESATLGAS